MILIVGPLTLSNCLSLLISEFMAAPGTLTSDLLMLSRKQTNRDFLILFCEYNYLLRFLQSFHQYVLLRKENICVVLIICNPHNNPRITSIIVVEDI